MTCPLITFVCIADEKSTSRNYGDIAALLLAPALGMKGRTAHAVTTILQPTSVSSSIGSNDGFPVDNIINGSGLRLRSFTGRLCTLADCTFSDLDYNLGKVIRQGQRTSST